MEKINLTINLLKLDKSKIIERTYKDKEGNDITEKQYKMVLVKSKEPKFVAEGDTWKMIRTHFIADPRSKEERESGEKTNYLGEGYIFEDKDQVNTVSLDDINNEEEIPF